MSQRADSACSSFVEMNAVENTDGKKVRRNIPLTVASFTLFVKRTNYVYYNFENFLI